MELMMPRQGLVSGRLGRRMRSLGNGGSRVGASFVEVPLAGIRTRFYLQELSWALKRSP